MNAGDFKQEFCQAYLPDGETYVLHPLNILILPTQTRTSISYKPCMAWREIHAPGIKRRGPPSLPSASNKIKTPRASSASQSFQAINPFIWASTLMNSYIIVQASWLKQNSSDALRTIKNSSWLWRWTPNVFRNEMVENCRQWESYHSCVTSFYYQRASERTRPRRCKQGPPPLNIQMPGW